MSESQRQWSDRGAEVSSSRLRGVDQGIKTPEQERENLLNGVELYIQFKLQFDKFYSGLVESIEFVDIKDVISKYQFSNITLSSL